MSSPFIEAMEVLYTEAQKGDLTLRRIVDLLGEEAHIILILLFSLPYMLPVSIPGLSTPAGLLISLLAIMLFLKRPTWIPKRYENIAIGARTVSKISTLAERMWIKISGVVKERWLTLHDNSFFRSLNLIVFVLNAILLALPLPIPFTNTLPGIAIVLCALGHLEHDGVFIFLSYIWTIVVCAFFSALAMGAVRFF